MIDCSLIKDFKGVSFSKIIELEKWFVSKECPPRSIVDTLVSVLTLTIPNIEFGEIKFDEKSINIEFEENNPSQDLKNIPSLYKKIIVEAKFENNICSAIFTAQDKIYFKEGNGSDCTSQLVESESVSLDNHSISHFLLFGIARISRRVRNELHEIIGKFENTLNA